MELSWLDTSLASARDLVDAIGARHGPLLLSCDDADTVIVAAALGDDRARPLGVWLRVGEGYPAALAARDVATLSWLLQFDHVVVAADDRSPAHAQVVRALLTDDEVNLDNEVATLRGAYNRPAPPRPITVWSFDGEVLSADGARLVEVSREPLTGGTLVRYATRASVGA